MPRIKQEEQEVRERLVNKCFTYLDDNFHKFKEARKIRIAIDIIKKAIPQGIEHSGRVEGKPTQIVVNVVQNAEKKPEINRILNES